MQLTLVQLLRLRLMCVGLAGTASASFVRCSSPGVTAASDSCQLIIVASVDMLSERKNFIKARQYDLMVQTVLIIF